MKEIKILIRIDDDNNKLGFLVERETKDVATVSEVLKVIGVLDILKAKEISKLEKMQSYTMRKQQDGK